MQPAKFPFNVANTCKLWRDVAFEYPENWIDLQFDLACDPRPLLGAIAASKTLSFTVHVFTTAKDIAVDRKSLENERARSVIQALLLHAQRCTCIIFDLTYASSLPSPTPFLARIHPDLTDLILDYKIYDLPKCYGGTQIKSKPVPAPLKKLSKMSMCGSAFMDIIHLGTEWLEVQPGSNGYFQDKHKCPSLHLRDFEFPVCNNEMIDKEYTFTRFVYLLHFINQWHRLHLEDISLAYYPHSHVRADRRNQRLRDVEVSCLTLERVSRDFIAELFRIGNLENMECLHFISCSIPAMSRPISCFDISLHDVPAAGDSCSNNGDTSLYNLISNWESEARSLELDACSTFDENFINWLADDRGDGECEAYGINALKIKNCQNFTPSGIQRLVAAVNDPVKIASAEWNDCHQMYLLGVYGKGPPLEDEDISWFEKHQGETTIYWHVANDDGYTFVKEFQDKLTL